MESKELTITVNSYKNPELLRLCLDSIYREMSGTNINYEVIVTDSATEEDTEMLMRETFPNTHFFPFRENVGFKTMVNKSLEEAHGEYVLLINSDIVLTPNAIPNMLNYLKQHPEIGILSPKQMNFNGTLQQSCFRFYRPWTVLYRRTWLSKLPFGRRHLNWFMMKDYDHQKPKAVDWVMGSAMLVPRSAAMRIGPMDDRFFMYMEDVDWCRRFWEHGLKVVYYPEATVYHYHGKGSARGGFLGSLLSNRLTWYHIESALKYFLKYQGKARPKTED
jgi:N-acetylglucosaminyl-diphospho-decaprenol L-rhamnosyltransferase